MTPHTPFTLSLARPRIALAAQVASVAQDRAACSSV